MDRTAPAMNINFRTELNGLSASDVAQIDPIKQSPTLRLVSGPTFWSTRPTDFGVRFSKRGVQLGFLNIHSGLEAAMARLACPRGVVVPKGSSPLQTLTRLSEIEQTTAVGDSTFYGDSIRDPHGVLPLTIGAQHLGNTTGISTSDLGCLDSSSRLLLGLKVIDAIRLVLGQTFSFGDPVVDERTHITLPLVQRDAAAWAKVARYLCDVANLAEDITTQNFLNPSLLSPVIRAVSDITGKPNPLQRELLESLIAFFDRVLKSSVETIRITDLTLLDRLYAPVKGIGEKIAKQEVVNYEPVYENVAVPEYDFGLFSILFGDEPRRVSYYPRQVGETRRVRTIKDVSIPVLEDLLPTQRIKTLIEKVILPLLKATLRGEATELGHIPLLIEP